MDCFTKKFPEIPDFSPTMRPWFNYLRGQNEIPQGRIYWSARAPGQRFLGNGYNRSRVPFGQTQYSVHLPSLITSISNTQKPCFRNRFEFATNFVWQNNGNSFAMGMRRLEDGGVRQGIRTSSRKRCARNAAKHLCPRENRILNYAAKGISIHRRFRDGSLLIEEALEKR